MNTILETPKVSMAFSAPVNPISDGYYAYECNYVAREIQDGMTALEAHQHEKLEVAGRLSAILTELTRYQEEVLKLRKPTAEEMDYIHQVKHAGYICIHQLNGTRMIVISSESIRAMLKGNPRDFVGELLEQEDL